MVGYKIHCKCSLVVRREGKGLRHYVHLGTGNYNPKTARLYTDFSFFTSREDITTEVGQVFNTLTGFGRSPTFKRLLVAPYNLHSGIQALIERETDHAVAGQPARIIAKMNNLVDKATIDNLYTASQAGVSIDLIIRGTCCLVPGVKGLSENIRVRSIVGRYLEHARIYYFENHGGGPPLLLLGSADWMSRNFFRRVEVLFPVDDELLRRRIIHDVLPMQLQDNEQARLLQPNGAYLPVPRLEGAPSFSSQNYFMAESLQRQQAGGDQA
jgi:polyphosphate kinase